jgi:hypothetical protein
VPLRSGAAAANASRLAKGPYAWVSRILIRPVASSVSIPAMPRALRAS